MQTVVLVNKQTGETTHHHFIDEEPVLTINNITIGTAKMLLVLAMAALWLAGYVAI